jgi:hypothetical protein
MATARNILVSRRYNHCINVGWNLSHDKSHSSVDVAKVRSTNNEMIQRLVFEKFLVRISDGRLVTLTEVHRGFPSLRTNAGIKLQPFASKSCPIHFSSNILPFDATQYVKQHHKINNNNHINRMISELE